LLRDLAQPVEVDELGAAARQPDRALRLELLEAAVHRLARQREHRRELLLGHAHRAVHERVPATGRLVEDRQHCVLRHVQQLRRLAFLVQTGTRSGSLLAACRLHPASL
jgi:hypothetical protein